MSNLNTAHIRSRLIRSLPELDRRLLIVDIDDLTDRLSKLSGTLPERITLLLSNAAEFRLRVFTSFQELMTALPKLRTDDEKKLLMMDFLEGVLHSTELNQDRKAFERWMDVTAVRERARVAMHESDRRSEILLCLLKDCLIEMYSSTSPDEIKPSWSKLDISRHLENELNDSPRWQNQVATLKVWEGLCRSIPEERWRYLWNESWDRRVKNILSTPEDHVWLQLQAFRLYGIIEPSHALAMIHHRFSSPAANPDDVFLRTSLLDVVETTYPVSELTRIITEIFHRPDPSEHVLINAARKLAVTGVTDALPLLSEVFHSQHPSVLTDKVQAAAAISLETIAVSQLAGGADNAHLDEIQSIRERVLPTARGYRFQLALVEGLGQAAFAHAEAEPGDRIDEFDHRILVDLDRVIASEDYADRVRRKASEIRESVILNRDTAARNLYDLILAEGQTLSPGNSFRISSERVPDEDVLGRVLARISVTDYGYYAQPVDGGYRIWRGELFKRRLWRILHELNHLDPAKRQGFVHTIGRVYPGIIRAHARYLAETTETKVPGERVFFRKEYSWRPFIPTIDDVLSMTLSRNAGKTIRLFSSEGVFTMNGPASFSDRLSIWWYITLNYGNMVEKRNYDLEDIRSGHARNFTQVLLEDFGFNIDFKPHYYIFEGKSYSVVDPHITAHMYPIIRNQLDWRPLS